jgi:hypothetical protein
MRWDGRQGGVDVALKQDWLRLGVPGVWAAAACLCAYCLKHASHVSGICDCMFLRRDTGLRLAWVGVQLGRNSCRACSQASSCSMLLQSRNCRCCCCSHFTGVRKGMEGGKKG